MKRNLKRAVALFLCVMMLAVFTAPVNAEAASFVSKKTTVKATVVSQSKVKISWNKVAGAKGYKIYISKKKNGGYILVKTLPASKTSYVHSNRTPEKKYYYKVRAYRPSRCIPGKTTYTRCSNACSVTIKSYIRNEKPVLNLNKPSTLYWNEIKGADGYIVYRSTDNGKTFTKLLVTDKLETVRPDGETGIYYIKAYKKYGDKTVYSQESNRQEITEEDWKPEEPPVPPVPPYSGGGGSVVTPPAQEESSMLIRGDDFRIALSEDAKHATKLVFTDVAAPEGTVTRDLSTEGNGSIAGWLDGDTYYVSTQESGKKVLFNPDCYNMFYRSQDDRDAFWTSISFKDDTQTYIDTSKVTNMREMFTGCSELTGIDVSMFDTSHVTTMFRMFGDCSGLTSLDLGNFNTENVVDMSGVFYSCTSINFLDLGMFDTGKVEDMSALFYNCSNLKAVDISSFNTVNVTNMSDMFGACRQLAELDLNNFNTGNVTSMSGMFYECDALTALDLSSFDTHSVTDMCQMLYGCNNLQKIDVSSFDTDSVENINMNYIFFECPRLQEVVLGSGFKWAAFVTEVGEVPPENSGIRLPAPQSEFISGADGKWYNGNGVGFAPSEIPSNVAGTYYASPSLVPQTL